MEWGGFRLCSNAALFGDSLWQRQQFRAFVHVLEFWTASLVFLCVFTCYPSIHLVIPSSTSANIALAVLFHYLYHHIP